jgi:hypothetical protein
MKSVREVAPWIQRFELVRHAEHFEMHLWGDGQATPHIVIVPRKEYLENPEETLQLYAQEVDNAVVSEQPATPTGGSGTESTAGITEESGSESAADSDFGQISQTGNASGESSSGAGS